MSNAYQKVVKAIDALRESVQESHEAEQDELNRRYRALASMKKAELLDLARQLTAENMRLEARLGIQMVKGDVKAIQSNLDKAKHRKGPDAVNKAKREFWRIWRKRYVNLRNDGMKPMAARRKVGKEIKEMTGRNVSIDTLKRQLK